MAGRLRSSRTGFGQTDVAPKTRTRSFFNGGVRLSPVSAPEHAPRDWRSQCERERARADAAEARAEELRWAEVAARSDGGSWKSRFKACRRRLSEAVEETKEARLCLPFISSGVHQERRPVRRHW